MTNLTYTIEFQQVTNNKNIITGNKCNAISFTNKGTDTVYINNSPLATNESLSINGHIGEYDKTTYKVQWQSGATSKSLLVQIKRYN